MASQLFREESKLKGLSGVKTEQGKAGLNVREIKQAESHRDEDRDGRQPLLFTGHFAAVAGTGLWSTFTARWVMRAPPNSPAEDFGDSGGLRGCPQLRHKFPRTSCHQGSEQGTTAGTVSHGGLQYQVTPQVPGRMLHQQ